MDPDEPDTDHPEGCNVLVLGNTSIPFRRPNHVSAEDFQAAIDRALNSGRKPLTRQEARLIAQCQELQQVIARRLNR